MEVENAAEMPVDGSPVRMVSVAETNIMTTRYKPSSV